MNKLEEQLEHLNFQAELNKAKRRRGQVAGNPDRGYSVCQCSSENFINYSDRPFHTRAAFVSTWLIGFNADKINEDTFKKNSNHLNDIKNHNESKIDELSKRKKQQLKK